MNIVYVTTTISIALLFVLLILAIVKPRDLRYQLAYVVAGSFFIGITVSIILINYSGKSALIWPGIFLIHIFNKTAEIFKKLN